LSHVRTQFPELSGTEVVRYHKMQDEQNLSPGLPIPEVCGALGSSNSQVKGAIDGLQLRYRARESPALARPLKWFPVNVPETRGFLGTSSSSVLNRSSRLDFNAADKSLTRLPPGRTPEMHADITRQNDSNGGTVPLSGCIDNRNSLVCPDGEFDLAVTRILDLGSTPSSDATKEYSGLEHKENHCLR
jgi:hypothetical protein